MTKKTEITNQERELNKLRCPICGKFHPFLAICPYIRSQQVEQIRDTRNPTLRGRITTTKYFPRPELLDSAVESLDEAEETLRDQPK